MKTADFNKISDLRHYLLRHPDREMIREMEAMKHCIIFEAKITELNTNLK